MVKVYLVMDNDWESNVVVFASLDAGRAQAEADRLNAIRDAKGPPRPNAIQSYDVEEHDLA